VKARQRRHRLLRRDLRLVTFKITQSQEFFPSPIFADQLQLRKDVEYTRRMNTKQYNQLMAVLKGPPCNIASTTMV